MSWIAFLMPAAFLLIADALGWIDLTTRPLPRVIKWVSAAVIAWLLPELLHDWLRLKIDEKHLDLWKLFIIGMLGAALVSALIKWLWRSYGPVSEGFRRCRKCRMPVLKVMLECPHCKRPV